MNLRPSFDFAGVAGVPLSERGIRVTLLSAVVAVVALHSSVAAADESAAAWLFNEGRALMLAERFDEACPMLVESQKLEPHVGTLLNVAACHELQGKIGSAWTEYQQALIGARAEDQTDRVTLAELRIAVLEPRVPWLRVFAPGKGVSVMLDGALRPPASLGKEIPVDPGLHHVQAVRPDFSDFEERVELREGEHRTVVARFVDSTDMPLVAPPPSRHDASTVKRGRFGLEAGLFGGFLFGRIERAESAHGVTGGANLRAGYAATDAIDLGVRFLFGPEIGDAGAGVLGGGPSAVVHLTDWFSVGVWALFGNATLRSEAVIGGGAAGAKTAASHGSLGGGPGVGLELAVRLARFGRHELLASSTPLLVAGEGRAVLLPLGLSYRFQ